MTKLTQFLAALTIFITGWLLFIRLGGDNAITTYVIIPLPLHLLILFGIYSVVVVAYRTLTFNDCPEAAKELQLEIEQARKELRLKGLKF